MARYCHNCGAPVAVPSAKFCDHCGTPLVPGALPGQQASPVGTAGEKSPFLALLCSTFLPGLGQVYNGKPARGFAVFLGTFFGLFVLIIPGLIVWIYGVHDAYSTAHAMNAGKIPVQPANVLHMVLFIIVVLLIVGTVLMVMYYVLMSFMTDLFAGQAGYGNIDINSLLKNPGQFV